MPRLAALHAVVWQAVSLQPKATAMPTGRHALPGSTVSYEDYAARYSLPLKRAQPHLERARAQNPLAHWLSTRSRRESPVGLRPAQRAATISRPSMIAQCLQAVTHHQRGALNVSTEAVHTTYRRNRDFHL